MSLNIPERYNFLFKYICQGSFIWVWTSNILYYHYRLLVEIYASPQILTIVAFRNKVNTILYNVPKV